jgi:hypothetical protein
MKEIIYILMKSRKSDTRDKIIVFCKPSSVSFSESTEYFSREDDRWAIERNKRNMKG